jgi:hypothetical protein
MSSVSVAVDRLSFKNDRQTTPEQDGGRLDEIRLENQAITAWIKTAERVTL